MRYYEHIDSRPDIMLGKPVVKGTRIPVELILRKLGEGGTTEELLDAYPNLTREDIRAVLIYAADIIRHDDVIYLQMEKAS